jgi:hypothetical protein
MLLVALTLLAASVAVIPPALARQIIDENMSARYSACG